MIKVVLKTVGDIILTFITLNTVFERSADCRFHRIPIIFGCIYRALLFLQFCHCLSEIAQCCTYVDLKKTEEKQNTHLAVGVPTVCYFANSISEEGKKTERK